MNRITFTKNMKTIYIQAILGARSYEGEEAWPTIIHVLLSGHTPCEGIEPKGYGGGGGARGPPPKSGGNKLQEGERICRNKENQY